MTRPRRYNYATLEGERDRYADNIEILNAELEAFRQDTLEDTVRSLEHEITGLRASCDALKEEVRV